MVSILKNLGNVWGKILTSILDFEKKELVVKNQRHHKNRNKLIITNFSNVA